ncbi:hypothetical protein BGZ60DRAFT_256811 [Tricladium varicosporioides]|nr:hypothetical protein BGZ60DRAFT_256811 [Hymenoscyphus varicosporioides]
MFHKEHEQNFKTCKIFPARFEHTNREDNHQGQGDSQILRTPTFECRQCPAIFIAHINLIKHHDIHNNSEVRKEVVLCDKCPAQFKYGADLSDHKQNAHCFSCQACIQNFGLFSDFETHQNEVHQVAMENPSLFKSKCLYCGVIVVTAEQLEKHLDTSHKFHCRICPKVFYNLELLWDHLEANHLFDKPMESVDERPLVERSDNVPPSPELSQHTTLSNTTNKLSQPALTLSARPLPFRKTNICIKNAGMDLPITS